MAIVEQEQYDICPIPQNTEFDINIGSFSFETIRLIEGIIVGGTVGLVIFLLINIFPIGALRKGALVALGVIGGGALAIRGINGNSLTEHLIYMIKYKKNRRICYYSDRVKTEKKFFTESASEEFVLPRERLEAMYHKYISKPDKDRIVFNEHFDSKRMFFEEDIDLMGKPEELMSPRELKKYKKLKKKQEKEKLKKKARNNENKQKAKEVKVAGIRR